MSERNAMPDKKTDNEMSRRTFLRISGLAGAAGVVGVSLAGCGSSPATHTASSHAKPRRGGSLDVAVLGGSSSDSIEASDPIQVTDFARCRALYSTLATFDAKNNIVPFLAESIESNPSASVYTIRLRPGLTFHNGKPVTPADVVYSFQRVLAGPLPGAPQLAGFSPQSTKVLDSRTLQVTLSKPSVLFLMGLAAQGSPINIVPVGYDKNHPVGTGPFMYQSFTPGQESVFVRNPNYFISELPYLDSLKIIDYPDANARFNAFLSGQVDAIDSVPSAQVTSLKNKSGKQLLQAQTGLALVNYMRCDVAPFNDPNVRVAMKLIIDREKMIQVAGAGYGAVADDVLGKYFPSYDTSLPQRHQDIEQAKHLLKKAGREGMTVSLATADFTAGATEQAALLAQFASKAGFTISLNQTSAANLFGSKYAASNYATSWAFAQDFWSGGDYLYQASLMLAKNATVRETHFSNAQFDKLYSQANSTADPSKRYELIHEMQRIDFDLDGLLVPYYGVIFDAFDSSQFAGFKPAGTTGYSFDDYDFSGVYRV